MLIPSLIHIIPEEVKDGAEALRSGHTTPRQAGRLSGRRHGVQDGQRHSGVAAPPWQGKTFRKTSFLRGRSIGPSALRFGKAITSIRWREASALHSPVSAFHAELNSPLSQEDAAPHPHRRGRVFQKLLQSPPEAGHGMGETLLHGGEERHQHLRVLRAQQAAQRRIRGGAVVGPIAQDRGNAVGPDRDEVALHQERVRRDVPAAQRQRRRRVESGHPACSCPPSLSGHRLFALMELMAAQAVADALALPLMLHAPQHDGPPRCTKPGPHLKPAPRFPRPRSDRACCRSSTTGRNPSRSNSSGPGQSNSSRPPE